MDNTKTILSVIAIILTFVAHASYIRDTLLKKTTPHIYTWLVWGFATAIAYGLQVSAGAGVGSWVTLSVAIICFFIFLLGLRNGKKDITKSDTVFFVLSFVSLVLWLVVKQPVLAVILASSVDMLGFVPTIRKAWNKPYSETLFLYELNTFRHVLSFFALQQYNIVTWLFPVTWIVANGLFSAVLIVRRKQVSKN